MSEYRLNSCDVAIRQPNATLEDLIDVIEGNRVYIPGQLLLYTSLQQAGLPRLPSRSVDPPALYVLNKIDAISIQELDVGPPCRRLTERS